MAVSALVIIPLFLCSGCSVNSDENLQNDNKEDIICTFRYLSNSIEKKELDIPVVNKK